MLGDFGSKEDAMSGIVFTDEFKRDAVALADDQGHAGQHPRIDGIDLGFGAMCLTRQTKPSSPRFTAEA